MKKSDKPLFKNGIWIKEQQGTLTMGSMDDDDNTAIVLPEDLCSSIIEFEQDMVEALYGENRIPFTRGEIDVRRLMDDLKKKIPAVSLRVSMPENEEKLIKGSYDDILNLLEKFVLSSIPADTSTENKPAVYINASVLQGHLCIIYRDSDSVSRPELLKSEIDYITTRLNGEVKFKKTSEDRSYYDIMIPSQDR